MKNIYYVGIIVILAVLLGLFLISPFSPLNKASIDGHSINMPSGYTVQKASKNAVHISNGTNDIQIYSTKATNTEDAVKAYQKKYNSKYNITQKDLDTNPKITKTIAERINGTTTIYKYWFVKDNKVYNVQTKNPENGTEKIITTMISSI